MKKRNLALAFGGAIGAAVAVKMLTRAKSVDWDDVSEFVPHAENSHFTQVDGARIHYQEFGEHSNPTLILIHGYTASLYVWKRRASCSVRSSRNSAAIRRGEFTSGMTTMRRRCSLSD